MTQVKICGIRRIEDARAAVYAGADMLGFVFAPSPRRLTAQEAREIVAEVRKAGRVKTVGVFVNEDPETINAITALCGLDLVQLSGDEKDADVEEIGVPVVKALHVGSEVSAHELKQRTDNCSAPIILLDAKHEQLYGGTGNTFNWQMVPDVSKPWLLGGGLNAANVSTAIAAARPWGVDVSSGVESGGYKDAQKINNFIQAVRSTDESLRA